MKHNASETQAPSTEQTWYEKAAGKRKPRTKKDSRKKDASKAPAAKKLSEAKEERTFKSRPAPKKPGQVQGAQQPLFDAQTLPEDSRDILAHFDRIVASVRTLSAKQQVQLPNDIKKLSHTLTDERSSRRLGYMNDASAISAYISYFMWWNLVRLTRLFANLPARAFTLSDNDAVLDIGSGTLTVPIALWLSRPELRSKKLTFYCLDMSQNALAAGEELYLAVAAKTLSMQKNAAAADASAEAGEAEAGESGQNSISPWRIVRVRGSLGEDVHIREKAALITCANVFNEIIQASDMPTDFLAKKYTRELLKYLREKADGRENTVLLVEPGDPKSARFMSLMRDALLRKDFSPLAPCPHSGTCPMSGRHVNKDGSLSGKWCNFAFATADAPEALQKLSARAALAKERASLCFMLMKQNAAENAPSKKDAQSGASNARRQIPARITSDVIHLPDMHASGYYACSEYGLLLTLDRRQMQPQNGALVNVRAPNENTPKDKKSGALIVEL